MLYSELIQKIQQYDQTKGLFRKLVDRTEVKNFRTFLNSLKINQVSLNQQISFNEFVAYLSQNNLENILTPEFLNSDSASAKLIFKDWATESSEINMSHVVALTGLNHPPLSASSQKTTPDTSPDTSPEVDEHKKVSNFSFASVIPPELSSSTTTQSFSIEQSSTTIPSPQYQTRRTVTSPPEEAKHSIPSDAAAIKSDDFPPLCPTRFKPVAEYNLNTLRLIGLKVIQRAELFPTDEHTIKTFGALCKELGCLLITHFSKEEYMVPEETIKIFDRINRYKCYSLEQSHKDHKGANNLPLNKILENLHYFLTQKDQYFADHDVLLSTAEEINPSGLEDTRDYLVNRVEQYQSFTRLSQEIAERLNKADEVVHKWEYEKTVSSGISYSN